ncbi:IS66 family transposase [Nostoc commune]|uniref:IS66 family transposase n=1 Tax=Nostoc commune TaxID=1178 RepID=UPI002ED8E697
MRGSFPESVKAPVQYGARIRAVTAYLNHQHFIPEDRLGELLLDLFCCRMTLGTIANTTNTLAKIIEPVVIEIASEVKAAAVKHLDETGLRIGRLSSTVGDTVFYRVLYAFTPAPGGRGFHPHGHSVVLVLLSLPSS